MISVTCRRLISRPRLISCCILAFCCLLYFNTRVLLPSHQTNQFQKSTPNIRSVVECLTSSTQRLSHTEWCLNVWGCLQPILDDGYPNVPKVPRHIADEFLWYNASEDWSLQDDIEFSSTDIINMRTAHETYLTSIQSVFPTYVAPIAFAWAKIAGKKKSWSFSNADASVKGTRGIVTTAGGDYFSVALVSLRMMRRRGTNLPVEIFISRRAEYEAYTCEIVLPTLNARCIVLEDILQSAHVNQGSKPIVDISSYQYKVFAILFSSFSEVLFLDADNFPLIDIAPLFTTFPPFKRLGMVVWPDLWITSISPVFNLVSSTIPIPRNVRASTEAGQIIFNKNKHFLTILMAVYYNYYGPDWYYGLLCQSGIGWGDKETFVAAALAVDSGSRPPRDYHLNGSELFFDVREDAKVLGHDKDWDIGLSVEALIQFRPTEARQLQQHGNLETFIDYDPPRWTVRKRCRLRDVLSCQHP